MLLFRKSCLLKFYLVPFSIQMILIVKCICLSFQIIFCNKLPGNLTNNVETTFSKMDKPNYTTGYEKV